MRLLMAENINHKAVRKMQQGYKAVEAEVVISRNVLPNGYEYIEIRFKENDKPIYSFWNNPGKSIEPKHCGNKRQYAMVFKEIAELDNNSAGLLAKLSTLSDWNTGRIEITVSEISKKLKIPKRTLYRDIGKLVECGAVKVDDGKYVVNHKYCGKGTKKNAND